MSLATLESIGIVIGSVIGIIGFLIGIAALVGGNFRVARNAKIVADYEAGYKGLEAKTKGQEQEIEELQRQNAEKDSRIIELEHELADLSGRMTVLQEVVTGKSAIEELTTRLVAMADHASQRADTMNARIGETLAQVSELRTEVRSAHDAILTAVKHDGDKPHPRGKPGVPGP